MILLRNKKSNRARKISIHVVITRWLKLWKITEILVKIAAIKICSVVVPDLLIRKCLVTPNYKKSDLIVQN